MKFAVGQSVTRLEDQRLLTGRGCYTDDVQLPGAAHAFILRSPHAHADLGAIDCAAARAAPGVLAVLTGAEVAADGLGDNPCMVDTVNRDGSRRADTPYPVLARGRVRFAGEAVAMVVAESAVQARDAAELIEVDYRPLPAVTGTLAAIAPEAAQLWPAAPGNVVFDWALGDEAATRAALDGAARVVELELINNRIVVNSMEPRPIIADTDALGERTTLWSSTQGPSFVHGILAGSILKIEPARLRCLTPDVGGGFGMKVFCYNEHALVAWASRRLRRAVRYSPERSDAFLSDVHGRDNVTRVRAGVDARGVLLGLQVTTHAAMGAYLSNFGPYIPTESGANMLCGCYRVPALHVNILGVASNTTPVDAYRGAGRPEAAYVIERCMDVIARELDLTPFEVRRRNFISAAQMPYATPLGNTYDSGDFDAVMTRAMAAADWTGFEARRAAAAARGRLRGIGMATYIECCAGGGAMPARLEFNDDDTVSVLSGSQSNGQGHETAFTQLLSARLGIDAERIRIVQGDTDRTPAGFTGGSRTVAIGGAAVLGAADEAVARGKQVAASLLEAAPADVVYAEGTFSVAGTDLQVDLFAVARAARDPRHQVEGAEQGLDVEYGFTPEGATYPNGCHVVELEVDPDSGAISLEAYTVVDDFGAVVNPLLLLGQIHGGIVQGVGQALLEVAEYDEESGQLLTGSFMDYAMPRADLMPAVHFEMLNLPCRNNPLGIKGAGEAGAIGAPPAVINALVDALAPATGITHIDMPARPQAVWQLLQRGATAP